MLEKHAIVIRLNFAKTHEKLLAQNSQIFIIKKWLKVLWFSKIPLLRKIIRPKKERYKIVKFAVLLKNC